MSLVAAAAASASAGWYVDLHHRSGLERRLWGMRPWVAKRIERALGGYRIRVVEAEPERPAHLSPGQTRSVAVVGGGIAGISAASALA
ncbi:MAG: hypothetical protein AAGA56_07270, partial [Myxococcota bacterium]